MTSEECIISALGLMWRKKRGMLLLADYCKAATVGPQFKNMAIFGHCEVDASWRVIHKKLSIICDSETVFGPCFLISGE